MHKLSRISYKQTLGIQSLLVLELQGAEADNPEKKRGEVIARSFLEWSENKKRWAAGVESQTTRTTSFG